MTLVCFSCSVQRLDTTTTRREINNAAQDDELHVVAFREKKMKIPKTTSSENGREDLESSGRGRRALEAIVRPLFLIIFLYILQLNYIRMFHKIYIRLWSSN